MSASLQHSPIADPPRTNEQRSGALRVEEILHEAIESWAREFEYTLTDTCAKSPGAFRALHAESFGSPENLLKLA